MLTKQKTATIYTNSRYAFGVFHAVGTTCKSCRFLTSADTTVANGHIIVTLLQAIHLPTTVTIVHTPAHCKETDTVSLGNERAAKTAKYKTEFTYPYSIHFINLPLSLTGIL